MSLGEVGFMSAVSDRVQAEFFPRGGVKVKVHSHGRPCHPAGGRVSDFPVLPLTVLFFLFSSLPKISVTQACIKVVLLFFTFPRAVCVSMAIHYSAFFDL